MENKFNCIIQHPQEINENLRLQFIDLVTQGGQIKEEFVKVGLHRAELVGMITDRNKLITSCCLKNPTLNYKQGVFKSANAPKSHIGYPFELGYIATHPNYGGQGHCQKLLQTFMPIIREYGIYSTTRKPEMVYILGKFGFYKTGQVYKIDLELLLLDGIK